MNQLDPFPLLESAPDAMVIVDAQGRIRLLNAQAERLFGYTRTELIDRPIEVLVPLDVRDRHRSERIAFTQRPAARPMGSGLELHALRKDGSQIPVEISLSPIRTEREGPMIVSAIRDISERKRYEMALRDKNAELVRANASKDRFLALMSHELRTPLNAIIGFTGTLLMKLAGPLTDDQGRQLRIVQSSARHLLALINDMLDLSKVESGRVEIQATAVSIDEVVGEVVDSLRALAQDKHLDLNVERAEPIVVQSDRRAVAQILLNLTNNAVKYTQSGSITVRTATVRENGRRFAVIDVADTGIGIKPQDADRLFRAFEQLDRSSTRRAEGIGLGLYLSHKLALLLGGSLTYAPNDGSGSTFCLMLPMDGAP